MSSRGELMMLVGPSGCGKTTLISVIAAILDADDGEARVLGKDVRAMRQSAKTAFRRGHIGFVFQAYNLIPSLTAAENVAVPLLIRGTPQPRPLPQPGECWARSGWPTARKHCRISFPAASSSGSPSPGRWCTTRS